MNGNGQNGGNHSCPRCIKGFMLNDFGDQLCLCCGYRASTSTDRETAKAFLVEAIVARMISDDSNEINDILARDWKLAGLAAK